MENKKRLLILIILFLVIGFASVSTVLLINGGVLIGANEEDFDVYFSKAYENSSLNMDLIKDKATITFSTQLKTVGEVYVLDYDVTNSSKNYDAEVKINVTEGNDYLEVTNIFNAKEVLKSREIRSGRLIIKLKKAVIEEADYIVKCEITGSAVQKSSLSIKDIEYEDEDYLLLASEYSLEEQYKIDKYGSLENYYLNYATLCQEWSSSECRNFDNDYNNDLKEYKETYSETYLWDEIDKSNIEALTINSNTDVPENAIKNRDVSSKQNGAIVLYTLDEDEDGLLELYLGQEGKLKANPNSSYLFCDFGNIIEIKGIENIDTKNVITMAGMFRGCENIDKLNLSSFDTSNVVDMNYMFAWGEKLTLLDVSHFDTSNVVNMGSSFVSLYALQELDVSNFNTSKVLDMSNMFEDCTSVRHLDVSKWDTSNLVFATFLFEDNNSLEYLDVSNWDTSNIVDMSFMFSACEKIKSLDLSNFNTSKATDIGWIFSWCEELEYLDISSFDTRNVTNLRNTFYRCKKLTSLDLSHFNTDNVTNMAGMFYGCTNLKNLNIKNFNTVNVKDMSWMFENCSSLVNLDAPVFDMREVSLATEMFMNSPSISITLSVVNGIREYNSMFTNAVTDGNAKIVVNYALSTSNLVDYMISTKSSNSNVIKGEKVSSYNIQINSENVVSNYSNASFGEKVLLTATEENKVVKSFKINDKYVEGDSFEMLDGDAIISDVEVVEGSIAESSHYPCPVNITNKLYYENTFEGAKSITVRLKYEMYSYHDDYIYLYDSSSSTTPIGNHKYTNNSMTYEEITINSNYLKITYSANGWRKNNYYGFRAVIIPNY